MIYEGEGQRPFPFWVNGVDETLYQLSHREANLWGATMHTTTPPRKRGKGCKLTLRQPKQRGVMPPPSRIERDKRGRKPRTARQQPTVREQ